LTERFEVAVVGSGFAGSILARALAKAGRRVVLLERGRHPRFALGESSTPLAAIALERLAERYDLPDLRALAAYGRWLRELPEVGRGLKRGFTFLGHRPGRPFGPEPDGAGRLLVAASPSDEVADSHWLRAEVDAHLAARAAAEGVDLRDGVELEAAFEEGDGVRLAGRRGGRPFELRTGLVVDASGPGRFLGRHLPIPEAPGAPRVETSLLYGHFEGALPLAESAPPGPYPDERAAVHHLLDEGWMYGLRFDSGLLSAGIELPSGSAGAPAGTADPPEAVFRRIASRYPTLAAQLGPARAVAPVRFVPRLQYRLARAAGPRWLLLPGAFAATGPLYSTGIAWSLVAVERAARMLEGGGPPEPAELARYHDLLAREADWIDRLVAGGLRARHRFQLFAGWCCLYFAAASFAEASQRLLDRDGPWCREPFLGAGDPLLEEVLGEAERRLGATLAHPTPEADAAFRDWMVRAIAPRDLVGFDLPGRGGLHPVDLELLVARAHLLGLDPAQVRAALPRLRGAAPAAGGRDTIRP
jgi:FADH2 O2-dependent halogenase